MTNIKTFEELFEEVKKLSIKQSLIRVGTIKEEWIVHFPYGEKEKGKSET